MGPVEEERRGWRSPRPLQLRIHRFSDSISRTPGRIEGGGEGDILLNLTDKLVGGGEGAYFAQAIEEGLR